MDSANSMDGGATGRSSAWAVLRVADKSLRQHPVRFIGALVHDRSTLEYFERACASGDARRAVVDEETAAADVYVEDAGGARKERPSKRVMNEGSTWDGSHASAA